MALGVLLAVPLGVQFGPADDPALMVHIPYGAFGCSLVALGYAAYRVRKTKLLLLPTAGRLPALVRAFLWIGLVSVTIGFLRYLKFSGPISFVYQVVLLSYCLAGYWLLRDADDLLVFCRGIVLSASFIAFALVVYLLYSGKLADVHGLHNDIDLRFQILGWPNAYGCFLSIVMMFALLLLSQASTPKLKLLYGACVAVLLTAVIFTFSRSAYVMVLVSVLLLTFLQKGILRKVLVVALVGALALGVWAAFPELPDLLFYVGTAEVRLSFAELLLHDTKLLDPVGAIAGHGYQSLAVIAGNRAGEEVVPGMSFEEMSTHDEYMTMFLKTGLLGLAVFLAILFVVVRDSFRVCRKHSNPLARSIFLYWTCALLPLLLSMLANETLRYWPVALVFWMMAGALLNFRGPIPQYATRSSPDRRAPLPVTARGFSSASSIQSASAQSVCQDSVAGDKSFSGAPGAGSGGQ